MTNNFQERLKSERDRQKQPISFREYILKEREKNNEQGKGNTEYKR